MVPSLVSTAKGYNGREESFIEELERKMPEHYDGPVPILTGRPIWKREELSKAGGSEIYCATDTNTQSSREIRGMFAAVGQYVNDNVRWRSYASTGEPVAMPGQEKLRAAQ